MLDPRLSISKKLWLIVKAQFFLLGPLASIMIQLMSSATIFSSTIVPLGIKLFDRDSSHLAYAIGQLCELQQSLTKQSLH